MGFRDKNNFDFLCTLRCQGNITATSTEKFQFKVTISIYLLFYYFTIFMCMLWYPCDFGQDIKLKIKFDHIFWFYFCNSTRVSDPKQSRGSDLTGQYFNVKEIIIKLLVSILNLLIHDRPSMTCPISNDLSYFEKLSVYCLQKFVSL